MAVRKIYNDVYSVGAIDWDRTMFDALIPLPQGTSYNAYLVRGNEKTALIDTVEPAKEHELFENLAILNIKHVDYVISNHAEQDHSGAIPTLLELYPEAVLVTNTKCKNFLIELLNLTEDKFQVIEDREKLSLGNKTLEFIFAPWVHWPETMFTYLKEDMILFSCDFMGSHLASSQLFVQDEGLVYREAKRYYAEIMMPFSRSIVKHLQVVDTLELDFIAPSHGPVYNNPQFIIDAYKEWNSGKVKNRAVVLYISMHGSTELMALYFVDALIKRGIEVLPFNMVSADIGEIAMSLVDAATLVLASPAVLIGPHPNIVYAAYLINSLKPQTKFAAVIGSFGWGNKLIDQITDLLKNMRLEFLPPVLTKGYPTADDYAQLDSLADRIAQKHREQID